MTKKKTKNYKEIIYICDIVITDDQQMNTIMDK